jgi:copper chaperone CopZ
MRTTKTLGIALLAAAAGALAWIGLRADPPSYEPPPADRASRELGAAPTRVAEPAPAGFALRVLDVEGMCCSNCSGKLWSALTRLEGVRAAGVDPVRGTAEALVPATFDVARLERALSFDDYRARARP